MKTLISPCLIRSISSSEEPIIEISKDKYPDNISFSDNLCEITSFLRDKDNNFCILAFKSKEKLSCNIKMECSYSNNYYYTYSLFHRHSDTDFLTQIASRGGYLDIFFDNGSGKKIKQTIVISPAISKEDYNVILQDLYSISIQLLYDNQSIIKQDITNSFSDIDLLENRINKLTYLLNDLKKFASSNLVKKYKKSNIDKIKKFDSKVLNSIQNSVNNKALSIYYDEDYSIIEHKMIKNYLVAMIRYCKYLTQKYSYHDNAYDLYTLDTISLHENNLKQKLVNESKEILHSLKNQHKILLNKKELSEKTISKINILVKKLEKLLKNNIFANLEDNITIKPTHLFLHHKIYNKIYSIIQKDIDLLEVLNNINIEHLLINKQSDLYEKWCFIKIIYIFYIEYGFKIISSKHCTKDIINMLLKKGRLEENILTFKWDTIQPVYIELGYNYTFSISKLRPDFYIRIYTKDNTSNNDYYIFDSKYRNYQYMSMNRDLFDVCAEKYIYKLTTYDDVNIITSFIIHSDSKNFPLNLGINTGNDLLNLKNPEHYLHSPTETHNYYQELKNSQKNINNKFGYTRFLPSDYRGFKEIIRMIFEYHNSSIYNTKLKFFAKCWICGSEDLSISERHTFAGYTKYHITCKKCGEFWVKSHCNACKIDIVKHHRNYLPDTGHWFIYCQNCHPNEQPPPISDEKS